MLDFEELAINWRLIGWYLASRMRDTLDAQLERFLRKALENGSIHAAVKPWEAHQCPTYCGVPHAMQIGRGIYINLRLNSVRTGRLHKLTHLLHRVGSGHAFRLHSTWNTGNHGVARIGAAQRGGFLKGQGNALKYMHYFSFQSIENSPNHSPPSFPTSRGRPNLPMRD